MLRVFIVIISLVAAILIFPKTSMYEKFITTFNNQYAGDVFAGLSNGRTVFWAADLKSFIDDYSFAEKILGRGFSWIKDVNYSITGHRLWAHNDFINLLLSVGIFGLIVYFIVLIGFFRKIKNKKLLVFVLTFVFACALLNGFYLYFPLVASVVFIIHYQYIFPSCFWSEQAAC